MKCLTHYGLFIWVLGYFGLFLCNSRAGSKSTNQTYIGLTLHLGCLRLQRHQMGYLILTNWWVMKCLTHYGIFIWVLGYLGLFLCNSCAGSKSTNQTYISLTLHLGCLRLRRHQYSIVPRGRDFDVQVKNVCVTHISWDSHTILVLRNRWRFL